MSSVIFSKGTDTSSCEDQDEAQSSENNST